MNQEIIQPALLGISDTSRYLGVCRSTVYNLLKEGDLEDVKIGNRRLIKFHSAKRIAEEGAE